MKQSLFLFSFLILYVANSCKRDVIRLNESDILSYKDIISLFVRPNNDTIDIYQFIDSIYYVKLEFLDESIIGHINKIIIFDNRIFVLDGQTSSIFIFDIKGKYISKICKIGNGPGEYNRLDDFDIDRENQNIIITDLLTYWNIRYDINGNFISRKKIPLSIEGLASLSNGQFVSFSNFRSNTQFLEPEYNLLYLDSMMQIEKGYFQYQSSYFHNPSIKFYGTQSGPFYKLGNELHFHYKMKNEIYIINQDGVFLKYQFDFNGMNFDYSRIYRKRNLYEYFHHGKYWTVHNVCETPDILYFSFFENSNRKLHYGFLRKSTKNIINSSILRLGKFYFSGYTIASYDNWFISVLEIDELLNWKNSMDNINEQLSQKGYNGPPNLFLDNYALINKKRLADELTVDDNPVLMFYRIKPF